MATEGVPGDREAARIQLCGRFVVRIDDHRIEGRMPGRQGRLLFAYLTIQNSRTATRDELVEALWPEELPSAPEMALSALLSKLRKLLGDHALEGRGEITLQLPPGARIDVEHAANEIHRAESLIALERWRDAAAPTMAAYSIAERPFLRGERAPWIDDRRREMEEIYLRAIECYARIGLEVRGHEVPVVIQSARRLIELAPYRESGYCLLMEALAHEGNVAEAMRIYERLRMLLREELGTSPSGPAQLLHDRLLARS
jgi:DNA-binding SARP family transcriptional activator